MITTMDEQSNYITIFTARIGHDEWDQDDNISLFKEKERVADVSVVEKLFTIKANTMLSGIKSCFDSLSLDDKKAIISEVIQDPEDMAKNLIKCLDKNADFKIPDPFLKQIWEEKSQYLIDYAPAYWSVYQSKEHKGVYVIDILNYSLDEEIWISGLYQLAKTINPTAKHINIVFHDKDTSETHDCNGYTYTYSDEEVKRILPDAADDEVVKVLSFSHTTQSPVYLVLKETYTDQDESIPSSVDKVHRQISIIYLYVKYYLDRFNNTINKKDLDPIGSAYKEI